MRDDERQPLLGILGDREVERVPSPPSSSDLRPLRMAVDPDRTSIRGGSIRGTSNSRTKLAGPAFRTGFPSSIGSSLAESLNFGDGLATMTKTSSEGMHSFPSPSQVSSASMHFRMTVQSLPEDKSTSILTAAPTDAKDAPSRVTFLRDGLEITSLHLGEDKIPLRGFPSWSSTWII